MQKKEGKSALKRLATWQMACMHCITLCWSHESTAASKLISIYTLRLQVHHWCIILQENLAKRNIIYEYPANHLYASSPSGCTSRTTGGSNFKDSKVWPIAAVSAVNTLRGIVVARLYRK